MNCQIWKSYNDHRIRVEVSQYLPSLKLRQAGIDAKPGHQQNIVFGEGSGGSSALSTNADVRGEVESLRCRWKKFLPEQPLFTFPSPQVRIRIREAFLVPF